MNAENLNGVIKELAEWYPELDTVEFLQNRLQLPLYKAEELAKRIEKKFLVDTSSRKHNAASCLYQKSSNHLSTQRTNAYCIESLSPKQYEQLIDWLLVKLGYVVDQKKLGDFSSVNYIATKNGEKTSIQSIWCIKDCQITDSVFTLTKKSDKSNISKKSIVITSSYFTQQTIERANLINTELWDCKVLNQKIAEIEKDLLRVHVSAFPPYQGSLLQSLLRLSDSKEFIIEEKSNEKYDLYFPGIKYPLLTFQATSNGMVQCIFRIKNYEPVGENQGEIISQEIKTMLDELSIYGIIVEYLEQFLV